MNKKPYVIILASVFVLTLGLVVGNSYIHKSAKPELNTASNPVKNPTGMDKSKIANKTIEDKLVTGRLRQENGKTIVNKSVSPQAEKFIKQMNQINSNLAEDMDKIRLNDKPATDVEMASIIAKGNELIAKVDREHGLDTRGFVDGMLNSVPDVEDPELQTLDKKLEALNAQTKEIQRGLR